jgi:hypothetical protein
MDLAVLTIVSPVLGQRAWRALNIHCVNPQPEGRGRD